ncbi:MAG TPA: hypothetical protein VMS54_13290 [Vicinamibacterales bacterium]|nr:hypothetical protein [Vicinamibacterales bacterium]
MSGALRVLTKLRPFESPAAVYGAMAAHVPPETLVAFGQGAFRELRQELKSVAAVVEWVTELAIRLDRVILLNIPGHHDEESRTVCVAPPGWSNERLRGYIGARHVELEATFGEIGRMGAA